MSNKYHVMRGKSDRPPVDGTNWMYYGDGVWLDGQLSELEMRDALEAAMFAKRKPKIVCICGSTRFERQFIAANESLTLAGEIVLTVGVFGHSKPDLVLTDETKRKLDELHKRKIDLADYVMVLNVGGYIGESTRSEIEYAESLGKPVVYLEG